jgi:hypothetical protein
MAKRCVSTANILQEAVNLSQTSKSAFARNAGMNPSDLNSYLQGKHAMAIERAVKVLEANGIEFRVEVVDARR